MVRLPGHLLELSQGGVQAGFDRADRDLQDVGDLAILEVLVVSEDERLPQSLGESGHAGPDPRLTLLALQVGERALLFTDEQVDQTARVPLDARRGGPLVQADRGVSPRLAEGVDGLVRGDRVEPGADGPSFLVKLR